MANMSFEERMADLERVQGPVSVALNDAATLLQFDLRKTIKRSPTEPLYRPVASSHGFKEQWVLRWLLKKLGVADAKSTSVRTDVQQSFVLCCEFWSLLLNLTASISDDVCAEILLERHFHQSLVGFLRQILEDAKRDPATRHVSTTHTEVEGPPAKRRRLSPPFSPPKSTPMDREELMWTALQAACRCVTLFGAPSSKGSQSSSNLGIWTGGLQTQAALFGTLLDSIATIMTSNPGTTQQDLAFSMLNDLLPFWDGTRSAGTSREEERQQAFAFHCLAPCLSLLDSLTEAQSLHKLASHTRNALARLLALHVVFPLRSIFNHQFTKKWRATAEVLLYEHMDTMLHAYNRVIYSDGIDAGSPQSDPVPTVQRLSWTVLEVAAQSIPVSDHRKRQQEQQYLDSLFTWLVHITWPLIPHINSTGLVQEHFTEDRGAWLFPLERLLDVALSKKLNISLPVVSYVLQAVLATDAQLSPWSLLVKIVQLDLNVLVPISTSIEASRFIQQLTARIENSSINDGEYDLVRDLLVLPLMRSHARSRALGTFVDTLEQCLAEAMRTRCTISDGENKIPAVLVWEDDDVLHEFSTLSLLHMPQRMVEGMLKELIESISGLRAKIGPTVQEFAKLAMFSAVLQPTLFENGKSIFAIDQLASLFRAAVDALHRKTDFQGQRWRLRQLLAILVQLMDWETLPHEVDRLLGPETNFVSLKDVHSFGPDHNRPATAKLLEYLECFSLLVELAAKSTQFQSTLSLEVHHLYDSIATHIQPGRQVWNGNSYGCKDIEDLVAACLGKLLQRSIVFSNYPEIFKQFVKGCAEHVTRRPASELTETLPPRIFDLQMAVLTDEQTISAPQLRQAVFEGTVVALESSECDLKVCQAILGGIALERMGSTAAEKLSGAMHNRLSRNAHRKAVESMAQDLSYLLHLDTLFPGTFLNVRLLDDWWVSPRRRTETKDARYSPVLAMENATLSEAYLKAANILKQIFRAVWARAISSPSTAYLKGLIAWTTKMSEDFESQPAENVTFSCLQMLLFCTCRVPSTDSKLLPHQQMQDMRKVCLRKATGFLQDISCKESSPSPTLFIKLILDIISDLQEAETTASVHHAVRIAVQKLQDSWRLGTDQSFTQHNEGLPVSIQRKCLELGGPFDADLLLLTASGELPSLRSDIQPEDWTCATMTSLAVQASLVTRQTGSDKLSGLLRTTRSKDPDVVQQISSPVVVASVLAHFERGRPIDQHPNLAEEVAAVTWVGHTSEPRTDTTLLLALENCQKVLESYPLVVNQSTLDRALWSFQTLATATSETGRAKRIVKLANASASRHVYERLCAVMGALLGRHRRRLSDRFHLLIPVLQALLRCLFWPGQRAVESQRGAAANAITTFGKTLPGWVHDSAEPLPLSSADQLTRLLSSICNPTVSAARSSNKRRNELNDEVKKARKAAAQHMQYLVQEYCRCILDGQISPSMKGQLMPGIYRVMDAIDRDLMRAMNSGMDPSSRAIFKQLYDDWVRYGKWDKS